MVKERDNSPSLRFQSSSLCPNSKATDSSGKRKPYRDTTWNCDIPRLFKAARVASSSKLHFPALCSLPKPESSEMHTKCIHSTPHLKDTLHQTHNMCKARVHPNATPGLCSRQQPRGPSSEKWGGKPVGQLKKWVNGKGLRSPLFPRAQPRGAASTCLFVSLFRFASHHFLFVSL